MLRAPILDCAGGEIKTADRQVRPTCERCQIDPGGAKSQRKAGEMPALPLCAPGFGIEAKRIRRFRRFAQNCAAIGFGIKAKP